MHLHRQTLLPMHQLRTLQQRPRIDLEVELEGQGEIDEINETHADLDEGDVALNDHDKNLNRKL